MVNIVFDIFNKEHVLRLPKNVKCPHCGSMIHDILIIFGQIKLGIGTGRAAVYRCPECQTILGIEGASK